MNDTTNMDSTGTVDSDDVLVADETTMTDETGQTDVEQTEPEQTDTEGEDVSATDSLTVADTSAGCLFTDTNIVAKMDIVIMLLIVIIALRMFSPLANNHKRGPEKKEK